ncbi:MAG TPA: response regulator [Nitriliruptorales bacterium]|nr:response regulator [Nitriliruptorales bacterium]
MHDRTSAPRQPAETACDVRTAIVCGDDPAMDQVLMAILDDAGFLLVGRAQRGVEAVELAAARPSDVLLLDLAVAGPLGLRIIPAIHLAAPNCAVIVLSPLDTLDAASLEAGAFAVVGQRDLRGLREALERASADVT